jgi:hypothetical protein
VMLERLEKRSGVTSAVFCWGSVQITKKLLPTQPTISQDLSRSNVVKINEDSVMYPRRSNAEITPPHRR